MNRHIFSKERFVTSTHFSRYFSGVVCIFLPFIGGLVGYAYSLSQIPPSNDEIRARFESDIRTTSSEFGQFSKDDILNTFTDDDGLRTARIKEGKSRHYFNRLSNHAEYENFVKQECIEKNTEYHSSYLDLDEAKEYVSGLDFYSGELVVKNVTSNAYQQYEFYFDECGVKVLFVNESQIVGAYLNPIGATYRSMIFAELVAEITDKKIILYSLKTNTSTVLYVESENDVHLVYNYGHPRALTWSSPEVGNLYVARYKNLLPPNHGDINFVTSEPINMIKIKMPTEYNSRLEDEWPQYKGVLY